MSALSIASDAKISVGDIKKQKTVKIEKTVPFGNKMKFTAPFDGNSEIGNFEMTLSMRKIGTIETGIYNGAELLLARIENSFDGPCYPVSACGDDVAYLRLVKAEKEMILLGKASPSETPWLSTMQADGIKKPFKELNPFKSLGLKLKLDMKTELDGFIVPKVIEFTGNIRKKISFKYETDKLDETMFEKYQTVDGIGDIFVLKASASPALLSFADFSEKEVKTETSSVKNFFYLKTEDGIYSIYSYQPDIYKDEKISKEFNFIYTHQVFLNCAGTSNDFLDVVSEKVDEKKLKLAGTAFNGDKLYYPPENLLNEFYRYYEETKSGSINTEDHSTQNKTSETVDPDSLAEFRKLTPILLWKSPLNQWVRFVRIRFLKPHSCD
jgi:hypothetical protein